MAQISLKYVAAGGNRHPSSADWDTSSGLLAYGAGRNIALWQPLSDHHSCLKALLAGHVGTVSAIRFFPQTHDSASIIISGSVDKSLRIWRGYADKPITFSVIAVVEGHQSSVNCIAVSSGYSIFLSGSADALVRVWRLTFAHDTVEIRLLQSIQTESRYFPLALAFCSLGNGFSMVMAAGGTSSKIQIYTADSHETLSDFVLRKTLTGHEGWIRSVDFIREGGESGADLLLASASQDKHVRLWRISHGESLTTFNASVRDPSLEKFGNQCISNKAHHFEVMGLQVSVTFEALLIGHDDWIYTVHWNRARKQPQLLSASADNSLAMWQADSISGVWILTTRLGEIKSQKGSMTATGSSGGFWMGLWSPAGSSVLSLGRTGSWRHWAYQPDANRWIQKLGVSGHVGNLQGVAWAKDGSYLLSTSSDQTTRLHAEWKRGTKQSWHEFARPQIHGYDLSCVDTIGDSRFISGADEKLLRVFEEPRAVATVLEKLCRRKESDRFMVDAANIPALGLSNSAVQVDGGRRLHAGLNANGPSVIDTTAITEWPTLSLHRPPLEDDLARYTSWPESEKVYGHGYQISAVATSHNGRLVATACRASSIDHAVIRIYNTEDWHEIQKPLAAHTLTITCMRFTDDDRMLLSVGRDRQWVVWDRNVDDQELYQLYASNAKGHLRMIFSGAWAPSASGRRFATGGRDKTVKVWTAETKNVELGTTIDLSAPVTCVTILPVVHQNMYTIGAGTENGDLHLYFIDSNNLSVRSSQAVCRRLCPSMLVTQLMCQPKAASDTESGEDPVGNSEVLVAVASEDSSLRILSIDLLPLP